MEALKTKDTESDEAPPAGRPAVEPFGAKVATSISLVLPMFNEGPSVDFSLSRALDVLERRFADFEIVVADDASTDDSVRLVEAWTKREPRIKLVRLARNQRFGGALRAGIAAAEKEFLFYTDFDLPIDLTILPQLLDEFADADVLTGFSANRNKNPSWRTQVVSFGYNFLVRTLFGLRLRDINFGFKAIRRSTWQRLVLRSTSPFVDAELFIQAQRLGFRVKQVPVPFSPRHLGTSRIRRLDVIACTLRDMIRLRVAPPR